MSLTRREAIVLVGAGAVSLCLPGSAAAHGGGKDEHGDDTHGRKEHGEKEKDKKGHKGRVAWRRSGRGRRVSRAVNIRNANLRYKNKGAAKSDRAHPGDTSQVVSIDVSDETYRRWFGNGAHRIDLRRLADR
jgi:hypothetical protein